MKVVLPQFLSAPIMKVVRPRKPSHSMPIWLPPGAPLLLGVGARVLAPEQPGDPVGLELRLAAKLATAVGVDVLGLGVGVGGALLVAKEAPLVRVREKVARHHRYLPPPPGASTT